MKCQITKPSTYTIRAANAKPTLGIHITNHCVNMRLCTCCVCAIPKKSVTLQVALQNAHWLPAEHLQHKPYITWSPCGSMAFRRHQGEPLAMQPAPCTAGYRAPSILLKLLPSAQSSCGKMNGAPRFSCHATMHRLLEGLLRSMQARSHILGCKANLH